MRLFRSGLSGNVEWVQNGIMPRVNGRPLSYFLPPVLPRTPDAWINCICSELVLASDHENSKCTKLLAQRFRNACVFDPPDQASRPHPDLEKLGNAKRILLIDEADRADKLTRRETRYKQFDNMVAAARRAHPDAEFWLGASASLHSHVRLSHNASGLPPDLRLLDRAWSLCASISYFDSVYTVGAPEGMQALLSDVPLHVFGTPYYAGWGLTCDHAPQPRRSMLATLENLFHAVFVRLSQHLDAEKRTIASMEALLCVIEAHRATINRFVDVQSVAGIRFQWWKRPFATPYLCAGDTRLRWIANPRELRDGEHAALWGNRSTDPLPPGAPILRIEDGFLHSTGLGSDHVAPLSQIIDRRGLYFDPSRPSDLTVILNEAEFTEAELARARALRNEIARLGLTKYNLGRRAPTWRAPNDQCIVLVAGQVADDASIRLGTRGITTAEQLLREVRSQRPNAFIVYKPHPDVLSGNRRGLIEATALADKVETESDLISLIEIADEVHTLSSLSGFEALIRQKAVYTYGLPFYAGWGLTNDALAQPWRTRKLSLDMLSAGVLLRYPIYWDWTLQLFTTPEAVVRKLAIPAARPLEKIQGNRLRPFLKALRWCRNGLWHLADRCRRSRIAPPPARSIR